MASTKVQRYEKASCKYCSDEISINALARHEQVCQNSTPEDRALRKRQREERYTAFLRNRQPTGTKQKTAECRYCHDQIGGASIARHEVSCAKRSPEEREHAKRARQYQMKHYQASISERERYRHSVAIPPDEPVVPDESMYFSGKSYQKHFADNGTKMKNPMAISMMVDEDDFALALGRVVISKLPELLPQLIPGLKIDAFATKHVRGPRQHKGEE